MIKTATLGINMTDDNLLPPLAELDMGRLFEQYVAKSRLPGRDHVRNLPALTSAAALVSVELTWPAVLKLARKLRDEGPIAQAGWVFRSVDSGRHDYLAFVAEHEDQPGGWLYNSKIAMVMTPEGKEALKTADEAMRLELVEAQALLPEADRKPVNRFTTAFMDDSPAKVAVIADPANYLHQDDCDSIDKLSVCAYFRDGMPPSYSDLGRDTLDEVLADFDKSYILTRVVEARPSVHRRLGLQRNPLMPSQRVAGDIPASIEGMRVMGLGIVAAGLAGVVDARLSELSGVRYEHVGNELEGTIDALGMSAVVRDRGLVGRNVEDTIISLWFAAAASDAKKTSEDFNIVLRLLREHGHTTNDNEFECNDAEDYYFVQDFGDGRGILWLRTQHGQYRIDFEEDVDGGPLRTMVISAQHDPSLEYGGEDIEGFEYSFDAAAAVGPGKEGFLARFVWDDENEVYHLMDAGSFSGRTIRDLNVLMRSMPSVSCCLEDQYPAEIATAP